MLHIKYKQIWSGACKKIFSPIQAQVYLCKPPCGTRYLKIMIPNNAMWKYV